LEEYEGYLVMEKHEFKKALDEASNWQDQMNQEESTKISFMDARHAVLYRIYKKFEPLL
jgi:hypothetical protein